MLVLGGDRNGHVRAAANGFQGMHGEEKNLVLELTKYIRVRMLTWLWPTPSTPKKNEPLITLRSGNQDTQLDFIIVRRKYLERVIDL